MTRDGGVARLGRPLAHYAGAAAYAALAAATLVGSGGARGVAALATAVVELAGAVALLDVDVAPHASVVLSVGAALAVAAAAVAGAPLGAAATLLAGALAVAWATRDTPDAPPGG